MAKQQRSAQDKFKPRKQSKSRLAVTESASSQTGLVSLPEGPVNVSGDGTVEAQVDRLGDKRLQRVQRQALATQIGRVQRNRHLQRIVASVNGDGKTAPYQLNTAKSSTRSASGALMRKSGECARPAGPVRQGLVVRRDDTSDLAALQRAAVDPRLVRPSDILTLQHAVGNQAVTHLLRGVPSAPRVQFKRMVGPADDEQVQEADHLVRQVVSQINGPAIHQFPVVQQAQNAPSQTVQRSPLSNQLANSYRQNGKGVLFDQLRTHHATLNNDPDVYVFIAQTFRGDDLWLANKLLQHGREANWPLHLRIEREMKGWRGCGGKGAVFNLLRVANGAQAGDANVLTSLHRVFAAGSDDLWLATQLLQYGPEANWPVDLQVQRELKALGAPTNWGNILNLLVNAPQAVFDAAEVHLRPYHAQTLAMLNAAGAGDFNTFMGKMTPNQNHNAQILAMLNGASNADFDTFLGKMTEAQTRQFLANIAPAVQAANNALLNRIKTKRILITGRSMVGSLKWRGGSGADPGAGYQISETTTWGKQNDFARWIRGHGPEPTPPNDTMNCWEGVLFTVYKAGVITKAWLDGIHNAAAAAGSAAGNGNAYYDVLKARMNWAGRVPVAFNAATNRRVGPIPAGHIIFIDGLDHVALSKGTTAAGVNEVLSLWVLPAPGRPVGGWTGNEVGVLQDTTLEQISQPAQQVWHAPPPW